ncbi:hypothetical protein LIER_09276 [Lithospermum erythrorhizon]|uniref:Uncharacterized protein n=1 Tax=Lithospermum erythrorhizon TaxID=34254 RepID=A0AAV3PF87_LITER
MSVGGVKISSPPPSPPAPPRSSMGLLAPRAAPRQAAYNPFFPSWTRHRSCPGPRWRDCSGALQGGQATGAASGATPIGGCSRAPPLGTCPHDPGPSESRREEAWSIRVGTSPDGLVLLGPFLFLP